MKWILFKINDLYLFWGIIVGCSLFTFCSYGLDYTLAPRFIGVSIALLICLFLLLKKKSSIGLPKIYFIPILLYSLYYLLCILSTSYSINIQESIFDAQRTFIGLCVFVFSIISFSENNLSEIVFLKTVEIATVIILCIGGFQISELNEITKITLYDIHSICGHKNLFSGLLFLLLIFNARLFLVYDKLFFKITSSFLIASCLVLIILLQTRSVWIACFISFALGLFLAILINSQRTFRRIFFALIFLIVTVFLVLILFKNKEIISYTNKLNVFSYTNSETGNERLVLWKKTIQLISQNPWIGVGAGNWQINYPSNSLSGLWRAQMLNVTFQRPHNDFLWVLSETGVFGFVFFYGIISMVIFLTVQSFLKNKSATSDLLYFVGLIGYLVFSFFDFPKERIEHTILSNCLLALLIMKQNSLSKSSNFILLKSKLFRIGAIFISLLLIINIFIGVYRVRGEHYTYEANVCRRNKDSKGVIKNCDLASSLFYSIDPTSIPVKWYRGIGNFDLNNFEDALFDFTEAYEANPYNQHVLYNLGSIYEIMNKHNEAKYFFQRTLNVNISFDEAKLNLAAISYNEGDYDRAMEWARTTVINSERKIFYLKIIKQKQDEKYKFNK